MRSDIFAVRCFEQVFDTFRQEKLSILKVTCIPRVEPAVGVNSGSSGFRFLIISFRDRLTTKQYFIVFAYLHFNSRQYNTHRTDIIAHRQRTGYSSRRFRQAVSNHHIDAYRMNKFIDLIGNGSTGSREKVSILNADRLLQ